MTASAVLSRTHGAAQIGRAALCLIIGIPAVILLCSAVGAWIFACHPWRLDEHVGDEDCE
jgi:hypothetical protein